MEIFAGLAIALYVGHHVGDYWVQTDHQSAHKGQKDGAIHCYLHVLSYLMTQAVCVAAVILVTGAHISLLAINLGLLVSGVTHYAADRREYGVMFKLARMIPGKARFLTLGVPRQGKDDNPSLGTGAWALDQSWHIFWGVFVAALVMAA